MPQQVAENRLGVGLEAELGRVGVALTFVDGVLIIASVSPL